MKCMKHDSFLLKLCHSTIGGVRGHNPLLDPRYRLVNVFLHNISNFFLVIVYHGL